MYSKASSGGAVQAVRKKGEGEASLSLLIGTSKSERHTVETNHPNKETRG